MADGTDTGATSDTSTSTATTEPDADATSALGDAGKKALDAERTRANAAEKALKALEARLKTIEDKDKSDLEKATEARTAAEKLASDASREAMRLRVGIEKRLPTEIVELLKGDTVEEMAAHADRLAEVVKQRSRPSGDVDQGRRGDAPARTPREEFGRLIQAQLGGSSTT